MHDSVEEFREIPGYEGMYEISNLKRVRSVERYVETELGGLKYVRGGFLKQYGKHVLGTYLSKNGISKWYQLDDLYDMTFGDIS